MYTMRKPIKKLQHLQEVCQINIKGQFIGKGCTFNDWIFEELDEETKKG